MVMNPRDRMAAFSIVAIIVLVFAAVAWSLSLLVGKPGTLPFGRQNTVDYSGSSGTPQPREQSFDETAGADLDPSQIEHYIVMRGVAMDHLFGIGRDADFTEAERILRDLHENGDVIASGYLFYLISIGPHRYSQRTEANEIWNEASEELYALSENGNLEAGIAIAYAYQTSEESKNWTLFMERVTTDSLDEGFIPGILLRAELLLDGVHLEENRYEAIRLFEICVEEDCAAAMARIGNINLSEDYPEHDIERGNELLEAAAKRGVADAWYKLAYHGWQEEMDSEQCQLVEEYLTNAWRQGEIGGGIRLVDLLLHDCGTEPDLQKIRKLLEELEPELSMAEDDNSFRVMWNDFMAELEELENQHDDA